VVAVTLAAFVLLTLVTALARRLRPYPAATGAPAA
jgi:hypothetical protein